MSLQTWLIFAGGGNKISAWVKIPGRQKLVDRISGSLFVAAGSSPGFHPYDSDDPEQAYKEQDCNREVDYMGKLNK